MARKVFVSFRYSDGIKYKEKLEDVFGKSTEIINCSEDEDRSDKTDDTIQKYLYDKLRGTSVTIVLLTPNAIKHRKDCYGKYDDWIYDEIRFSLEDRERNRCNGLVAVYTEEAKRFLITECVHRCDKCNSESISYSIKEVDNLFRKNMMNVKEKYKKCKCDGLFDSNYDSYCSLVSWEDFIKKPEKYIDIAIEKRENVDRYELKKRINSSSRYNYF